MSDADAIVIGAGPNGLAAALHMARAGLHVLVLERGETVGGSYGAYEFAPGYRAAMGPELAPALLPEFLWSTGLTTAGLDLVPCFASMTLTPEAPPLARCRDRILDRRLIEAHSPGDADRMDAFEAMLDRQEALVRPLILSRPPAIRPKASGRMVRETARIFDEMGGEGAFEVLRFWTNAMGDLLDRYFETPVLKAHLASSAMKGVPLGPYSPGTAHHLLTPAFGAGAGGGRAGAVVRGGMAALAEAMRAGIEAAGGEIRTQSPVKSIAMRDGTASGVVLENGAELSARVVLSSADVRRTVLDMMEWDDLPDGFVEEVGQIRARGVTAKAFFALDGEPRFAGLPEGFPNVPGPVYTASSLLDLERNYDDWKAQGLPETPCAEIMVPTWFDPDLAPPGKHVVTATVHCAALEGKNGPWAEEERNAWLSRIMAVVGGVITGFEHRVTERRLMLPGDYEEALGVTGGAIHHVDPTLDQIFFNRPIPELAQFRLPVRNLYLCGASVHPGGAIAGAAGANAAQQALSDLRLGQPG